MPVNLIDRRSPSGQTRKSSVSLGMSGVGGQAGLVGPDAHNIKLSLRRAKVVSEALVAHGIDPAWISIANQITVELTVATAGDLGDLASRRVDIILLKQD